MANPENAQRPDLQDLVAYLQGRGDETLRAQVLKRLDEDEEYLELMVDLVPMLREAGEIRDPDGDEQVDGESAAPPPPAPPLPFVARPAPPAALPPVALPPAASVIPAHRRWPALAILAALVPISLGIWLVLMPKPPEPYRIAQQMASQLSSKTLEELSPWEPGTPRGEQIPEEGNEVVPEDYLVVGGQIFALDMAVRRESHEVAKDRLDGLEKMLSSGAWAASYRRVDDFLSTEPGSLEAAQQKVYWEQVRTRMDAAYAVLAGKPGSEIDGLLRKGACWRAAWFATLQPGLTIDASCAKQLPPEARGADKAKIEDLIDQERDLQGQDPAPNR